MIDDFTPNEILDIQLAGVLAGPRLQDALIRIRDAQEDAEEQYELGYEEGKTDDTDNGADEAVAKERERLAGQLDVLAQNIDEVFRKIGLDHTRGLGRQMDKALDELNTFIENLL